MLLAEAPTYVQDVVPIYSLDGMTLLIGGFWFWCLARPQRIKNQTQFWAVFFCLLLIVLMYTLRLMFYNSPLGQVFCGVMIGLLQLAGLVVTVMYYGGLKATDVASELREAADDLRNSGEPEKQVIVPITPATPHVPPAVKVPPAEEPPRVVIDLPKKPPTDERLPLE
ncbi:MAG: hypothetical protein QM754_11160 [Tepidisphaeraceae bacterium]